MWSARILRALVTNEWGGGSNMRQLMFEKLS